MFKLLMVKLSMVRISDTKIPFCRSREIVYSSPQGTVLYTYLDHDHQNSL